MNNLNLLETRLRSWRPRQPSASLKQRIFSPRSAPREHSSELVLGAGWRWLAPVMGSFLLVLILSGPKQTDMVYFASTNHLLSLFDSGSSHAAFMAEGFHTKQNLADRGSFEWTRSSSSQSLALPASSPNTHTNTLIP